MIIILKENITKEQFNKVTSHLEDNGCSFTMSNSNNNRVLTVSGTVDKINSTFLSTSDGILSFVYLNQDKKDDIKPKLKPIKLKNGIIFDEKSFVLMAGPCSVEGYKELRVVAKQLSDCGCKILRGGAFKPRTSPYSFQGLGIEGLEILRKVADEFDMLVVSELVSHEHIDEFLKYVDIIQIGARNMQNFELLKVVGKTKKPVLLKRGNNATISEWLLSAEYIITGGNNQVILCERGIRTFSNYYRNTFDISSCLAIRECSTLPVIVDPSHASGSYKAVNKLTLASYVVGANGAIIEVHNKPEETISDGPQTITPKRFIKLKEELKNLSKVTGIKIV